MTEELAITKKLAGIQEGLEEEFYHAQTWAVSNSDLKVFGGDSPRHYAEKLKGAPEDDSGLTEDERKTQVIGKLAHCAILEPMRFGRGKSHHVKPLTYPAAATHPKVKSKAIELGAPLPWNGNATFCEKWEEEHQDLPIVNEKEERRILGARKAVLEHPVASALVNGPGSNEVSVFAKHPATGLWLRMRADRLTDDADGRPWCVDLKTVPNVDMFVKSARDYMYDSQNAVYEMVLDLVGIPNVAFCFVAFELVPRFGIHSVRIVMMDQETITIARSRVEGQLERLAECRRTDVWPLNDEEIQIVQVKRWTP